MGKSGRKPRVLLVLHELTWTGAPKVALDAFEFLRDEIDLRILVLSGGPMEKRARALAPMRVLVQSQRLSRWLQPWEARLPRGAVLRARGALNNFSPWLRAWRPDLIYINSVVSLHATRYLQLPAAPVLLHVHELGSALDQIIGRFPTLVRDLPAAYLADSNAVKDSLVARFAVTSDKISVVHPFIDAAAFADFSPRIPQFPDAQTPFILGGAGGLRWCKGPQLFLLTAAHLKELLGPGNVKFLYLGHGDPDARAQFAEMTRLLGLENDLEHLTSAPDALPFFRRFDAFALTSWEDACPLVALENMALGNVVACFAKSGGAPETLGDCGIVVPDFSPAKMAQELAQLAPQLEKRAQIGRAARSRALEEFVLPRQALKIRAKIREVAGFES